MRSIVCLAVVLLLAAYEGFAQTARPEPVAPYQQQVRSADPLENISIDVARMARSVETLSKSWKTFADSISNNPGMQWSEKQQKLILALEVLNRLEQSLGNMQKLKLEFAEKQSKVRLQLATVTDDLLPQSIDRYVALRGTTDAEELRDIRRQALMRERQDLSILLSQIGRELDSTNDEIRRTEFQVRTLRARVFGEVERELSGF